MERENWLHNFLGLMGRAFKNWVYRRQDQAALAGRFVLVAYQGLFSPPAQKRLIRKLILLQVLEIFRRSTLLLAIFGLMMGWLWT
ncbi:MAG: hypothetical protein LBE80_02070, partial [Deltaproteobacteria bacterium]|nr:hypothetical protein [Deltaproteobacteria bacterium]